VLSFVTRAGRRGRRRKEVQKRKEKWREKVGRSKE
jgi:hypothetical protein